MSLELRDVTVAYGALRAVDGVSLTLAPGEICGLVGPNGSGKSTLLNAINGITPVSGGSIALGGHDVTTAPPHELARLGVARTFQLIRLLHGLSVRENVLAGAYVRRPSDVGAAVGRALDRAGIAELGPVAVDVLSFGVQRRVEVARALVGEPSLLLLDEPAAGLSEHDLVDLGAAVRAEAERGCAVILVDHHLHFVLELCPRVVVLSSGRVIFDGRSSEAVQDQGVREAYVGG